MDVYKKLVFEINSKYLICSLYTLHETSKFFKDLDLKNETCLNTNNSEKQINGVQDFTNFYELLNNISLRRFSFFLLKPLLLEKKIVNEEIFECTILLEKYLKKFKYNYYHYFLFQNGSLEPLPVGKEINTAAIKSLFLLAGL